MFISSSSDTRQSVDPYESRSEFEPSQGGNTSDLLQPTSEGVPVQHTWPYNPW